MDLTSEEFWQRLGFSTCVIRDDDQSPYLLRIYLTPHQDWWRLRLGLPGLFLHHFYRSDHDREVHNHPWMRAWSFIFSGGYYEERLENGRIVTYKRSRFSINYLTKETFHRVQLFEESRGCWSLFLAGEKFQDWGFMSRDGKTFELWWQRDIRIFTNNTIDALQKESWHHGSKNIRERLGNQLEVRRLHSLLQDNDGARMQCRSRLYEITEAGRRAFFNGETDPFRFGESIRHDHLEALVMMMGLGQPVVQNEAQLMQALHDCRVPLIARFARGEE